MSDWSDNSGYSEIALYPSGSYESFVPLIDTEWIWGKDVIYLKANHAVRLFEDGNLQSFTLAETLDLIVHDVRVRVAEGTKVELYERGAISSVVLEKQATSLFRRSTHWKYRGATYPPFSKITFSEDGEVASFEFPD